MYDARQQLPLIVSSPGHQFGGTWTSEKLERVQKYLAAFVTVLKKRQLKTIYIDAFAGSGYVSFGENRETLFPEFADEGAERFIDGSVRRALSIREPFDHYYFIEKHPARSAQLETLKEQFPDLANSIHVRCGDANAEIINLISKVAWRSHRAVLFLDPYGMQVKWSTLEAVAKTGCIDVWYLFPLGVGINRLLKKNQPISPAHQMILDEMFGTTAWYDAFYRAAPQLNLFGQAEVLEKDANFDAIERFFIGRLKCIFPKVADKPLRLFNQKGNPLYTLCFAASNPGKGGEIALKIASHILKS